MSRLIKPYLDFRGGLNLDAAPDNLADNELMETNNCILDERGAVSKRKGTIPLNTLSYGAQVERLIEWPRQDGTKTLLAIVGATLCKINSDYTKTSLKVLDNAEIGFFFYADKFYFTGKENGTDGYWYYDGTNVAVVQLPAPGSAPTLTASGSGTGLGAGTYKGKVVFVNDIGAESLASAEASVTIAAGQQINWSNIPTGPAGTTKRRLYRTAAGGSVFKALTTISDNTTTTYTDTTPDANLGAASKDDNGLAYIKRCRLFLWHTKSQRIFAAKDANDRAALYYSEPGDPAYFKETNKLYPTTGDGPVYSLALFGDAMATIYQNSIWAWKGVSPATDAEWMKLPCEYGTVAERTPRLTPNSLTFLGQGGIISLSPGLIDNNLVMLTGDDLIKNLAKDKVASLIRSITKPAIACAVYDRINDRYMLAYTDTAGATRNSKVLVLDWGLKSYTIFTGWQVNDIIHRANGDLLIATDGYILKAEQGYKDWDVNTGDYKPIEFSVKTKHWNLDYPVHIKKTKRLFLASKQFDAEMSSVNLTVNGGYETLSYNNISLDESFTWGGPWGSFWGWSELTTREIKCKLKGHRFQVALENSIIDELITIYGIAFEYRVRKPRGVKVE